MSQAPVNDAEALLMTQSKKGYVQNIDRVNGLMHHGRSLSGRERNCVFLNQGDATFNTISSLSGWDFEDDSRGLALMDWDHDGKIDFWASSRTAPRLRFMHNSLSNCGDWIGFSLTGSESNRDAIGARVTLTMSDGRTIIRTLRAGEGFASQSSKRLHVGLGRDNRIKKLAVTWPNGTVEPFPVPQRNSYYLLTEGTRKVEGVDHKKVTRFPTASGIPSTVNHVAPIKGRTPLRLPVPAPQVRFKSAGKSDLVEMPKLKRPVLISLWSANCEFCRKELKSYVAESAAIEPVLDVVALCIDPPENHAGAAAFLKKINFPWRSGSPDSNSNELLATIFTSAVPLVQDLPTPSSLLIATDGTIAVLYRGQVRIDSIINDARRLGVKNLTSAERLQAASPVSGRWIAAPRNMNILYIPRMMLNANRLNDAAEYMIRAHQQLLAHKEYPVLLNWVGDQLLGQGKNRAAFVFYDVAARVGQDAHVVLNNVAWHLATHQDPKLRNGKLAVKYAHRAVELTNSTLPGYLDTLAAAYAEQGDFDQAISTARRALKMARNQNNSRLVTGLEKAIRQFQNRQPIR